MKTQYCFSFELIVNNSIYKTILYVYFDTIQEAERYAEGLATAGKVFKKTLYVNIYQMKEATAVFFGSKK